MCEKKCLKDKKVQERHKVCEAFIYPVGVQSNQNVNESQFFGFATIVTAVDESERQTKCNKIRDGVLAYVIEVISDAVAASFSNGNMKLVAVRTLNTINNVKFSAMEIVGDVKSRFGARYRSTKNHKRTSQTLFLAMGKTKSARFFIGGKASQS